MLGETYLELIRDPAHILFELTLTLIQDVFIGLLLWPAIKQAIKRHDKKVHNHCEDIHGS